MIARREKTRRLMEPIAQLDTESLKALLREANRDDKAEARMRLLETLRPALLELMRNKSWSSRKTAQFLKARNIKIRAVDIDSFVKANPFCERDAMALRALKPEAGWESANGGLVK
jgi:O-succinylbenzoate synthase